MRHRVFLVRSVLTAIFCCCFHLPMAGDPSIAPLGEELANEYDLDPSFYQKTTEAEGILIATSERVSDLALLEAAYQFRMMLQRINQPIADTSPKESTTVRSSGQAQNNASFALGMDTF